MFAVQPQIQRDEIEGRADPGDRRDHVQPAHGKGHPVPQHGDIVHAVGPFGCPARGASAIAHSGASGDRHEPRIAIQPLSDAAFAPFGDVLEASGAPDRIINQGLCGRWHDRARLDFGDGRAGISLFRSEPRQLPYRLDMVERHPDGSQAFVPMTGQPFLVIVAPD